MEQDSIFETTGKSENLNNMNTQVEKHEHHSHHQASSHHGHHSHHSSHSHSHHKKHRPSHHKSSLWKRFRSWNNKKISNKGVILAMSMVIVIMLLLLVGFKVLIDQDANNVNLPENGSNDSATYEPTLDSAQPDYTASTSSVRIPTYWKKEIQEKTETVKVLQSAGGKDCVSFVWASDTHIPDNSTARTDDIGKLMARMMDNCDIPFAVLTGDIGTRNSYDTEEELINKQAFIPEHLSPLWGDERLLVALGNHDGCYGDINTKFQKHLSPEKLWHIYFRKQALDSRRVFSDDGSYFYIDNQVQKIRFIVLNSNYAGKYMSDGNGIVINDNFDVSCYGQRQLDWFANVALDLPKNYGAIVVSHVPPKVLYNHEKEPYTVDCKQLQGIIDAYNNKSSFKGTYDNGKDGWTNSSISVNYKNAIGEVIAVFNGHIHQDTSDTTTMSCPIITITSAGASVNFGEAPKRKFGTDTETSFDVVTINRKTRTIHCTRVGAGEDRIIKY